MANADSHAPTLEFIFAADVSVDAALEFGDVAKGSRRIVPITGGTFSGPDIRGIVVPGGADFQVLRGDSTAELEARYTLRTDDGALIYVRNHALRHGPAAVMAALAAGRLRGGTGKNPAPRPPHLRGRARPARARALGLDRHGL